jgi:hypothetical protein
LAFQNLKISQKNLLYTGHSALNWLAGNPSRHVVAFDLGSLGGADVGEQFVTTVICMYVCMYVCISHTRTHAYSVKYV